MDPGINHFHGTVRGMSALTKRGKLLTGFTSYLTMLLDLVAEDL